jgi:EAL domain-containing protein (putative c-di-GMP-specific phosphodiesterase class I)
MQSAVPAKKSDGLRPNTGLCFIIDEDFAYRRELASAVRRDGISVVEFSNGARLMNMIDEQNPDMVMLNVSGGAPHECVRTLWTLRQCGYAGAVQLIGSCDQKLLDSFKIVGVDAALEMLPPLRKPITLASLNNIVRHRKLGVAESSEARVSLKEALARKIVTFLYQPKFDFGTGTVIGAEVVARVAHPQFGMLTPDQFMRGAEQDELVALTRLALISALEVGASLDQLGVPLRLAINISSDVLSQLAVSDLVQLHRPERTDWAGLLLEIPERQVIAKIDLLKTQIPKFKQSGVSLAIDNFGRGAFAFDLLNQVSFAEIKLDRSLIENCGSNPESARICKSVIEVAHNFGCSATAVGVSKAGDRDVLLQYGCDAGQGFLFAKPMTAEQIERFVLDAKKSASVH